MGNALPVIPTGTAAAPSPEEAFAECERIARTTYENFSIATRLVPSDIRRHFYSIYAYCRGVDDLGDAADGDREARLDIWQTELEATFTGRPSMATFIALQQTIAEKMIPIEPFQKLIEANRIDQRRNRYETFDELLGYCSYSANPVGHLVLYLIGHGGDARLNRLSDFTCTALQLANFWQDVHRDYEENGRIYIPKETLEHYSVDETVIASSDATLGFRRALKMEVDRARSLFHQGIPLVNEVDRRYALDLALFTSGGLSVLNAIESQNYDVLSRRPTVGKLRKARLFASAWLRLKLGLHPLPKSMRR